MTEALVAVVGSANLDIVVSVDRFPRGGETILGNELEEVAGGKGLNQAVAAARSGPCAFIGTVGGDEAGGLLTQRLVAAGVNVSAAVRRPDATGRAFIQVTPDGENSIVVMPLANLALEPADVRRALQALEPAVVLTQLEIPLESVEAAADWASRAGARFLLNPSPVRALPRSLVAQCDPLILNVAEAEMLTARRARTESLGQAREAYVETIAADLATRATSVVVTDGAAGAYVAGAGAVQIPGRTVTPVDTTGAGDAFAGTLAAALGRGTDLVTAAQEANLAAAELIQIPRRQR